MAKADGSVIIDSRLNTAGFGKGVAGLKSQFAGLGSSLRKLGGLIAAAFSVRAIVSFSKEAIQLGSDLQEVQNVVDVTFTTMNEQINEFAKNAAKTAGLSETMAKRYAGTFGAMAKSFRFTEAEAYTMATALTQLTGDVASFYNLTQDEAYTKLKSVFTGETESLKDLGVVMTQTALDDFALRKGLKKTTSQMTEQEKVALRYQFVLEQLSGASGDFVRTSDSWANQTRVLKLQFDQLKATLGQAFINALTPALKLLNQLIERFQVLADSFLEFTNAVFGNAGGASAGLEATAESAGLLSDNLESTEQAAKKVDKALAGFDEITKISTKDSEKGTSGPGISAGSFNVTADVTANVKDNVSPAIKLLSDKIQTLLDPLRNIDFSNLIKSLKKLGTAFSGFGKVVLEALEWVWFNILAPLAEWIIEDAAPAMLDVLSAAFMVLSSALDPVIAGFQILWEDLKPFFSWLGDVAILILRELEEQFGKVAQVFQDKAGEIQTIFSNLGDAFSGLFSTISPILEDLKTLFGGAFDLVGDEIAHIVSTCIDALVGLTDFFAGVFTGDWKRALNGLIGLINGLVSAVLGAINFLIGAINKLSWTIPEWVPGIGGDTFGFNIPLIQVPQLPYLANGAVIPPNAPFAAILGDQRHGTNIEAPLSTIQEAVALVMEDYAAANIAGHEATVAVLRDILEAVLGIHVGDDVIGQAVARYNARMAIIKGGNA